MVKDINKCGDFKQQQSRSLTTKHGEMGIPPTNFGMESTIQRCKPGYLKWVICHWVGLKNHCRNLPKYKWSRVSTTKKRVSCRFSRLDLLGLQSGRKRAETTESPWKVLEKSLKSPWKVLEKSLKSPWKDLEDLEKASHRVDRCCRFFTSLWLDTILFFRSFQPRNGTKVLRSPWRSSWPAKAVKKRGTGSRSSFPAGTESAGYVPWLCTASLRQFQLWKSLDMCWRALSALPLPFQNENPALRPPEFTSLCFVRKAGKRYRWLQPVEPEWQSA